MSLFPFSFTGRSHPVRVVDATSKESSTHNIRRPRSSHVSSAKLAPPSGSTKDPGSSSPDPTGTTSAGEVEVAQEAAEFAYQSFNQDTGGVASHSPSLELGAPQEIPLEDLSRKKKRHTGRKLSGTKLVAHSSVHPNRSHSHSPRRSENVRPKKGRATSLTVTIGKTESSGPQNNSSPIPVSSSPAQSSTSSSENSPQLYGFTRDTSSQSPKTLRPADAPTLSLIPQGDDQIHPEENVGPKLLPPTEVERIRSVSDVSSTSSDNQGELTSSNSSDVTHSTKPLFAKKSASEAEVNTGVHVAGGHRVNMVQDLDETASKQLTKLAQMVQQHYGSVDETEEVESSQNGSKKGSIQDV